LFFRALLRHSGMSTPASASGHYSKYYIHMIPKTVSIVPCLQIELYYYWISFEIQPDSEAEEAWERPRRHNKPGSPPRLTHILEISSWFFVTVRFSSNHIMALGRSMAQTSKGRKSFYIGWSFHLAFLLGYLEESHLDDTLNTTSSSKLAFYVNITNKHARLYRNPIAVFSTTWASPLLFDRYGALAPVMRATAAHIAESRTFGGSWAMKCTNYANAIQPPAAMRAFPPCSLLIILQLSLSRKFRDINPILFFSWSSCGATLIQEED